MATNLVALVQRLEAAIGRLEGVVGASGQEPVVAAVPAAGPAPKPAAPADSPIVAAFVSRVMAKVPPFVQSAESVGGACIEASQVFAAAFDFSLRLLRLSERCKKPTPDELRASVFPPVLDLFGRVNKLKDKTSPLYNHVAAISEGIQSVQWPVVDGPLALVQNYLDAANFTGNKVLMAKNPPHVAWYKGFKEILAALCEFLEEFCRNGLVWKATGAPVASELAADSKAAPSEEKKAPAKVEPRANPPVAEKRAPKKFEQGVNWVIQDFEGESSLEIAESEAGRMKGVMLDRLVNCTVTIRGKMKNILVNNCRKVNITCQSVVASTEIVACKTVKLQTTGLLPSVSIDNSDGVQVFLSDESKAECVFATSKSSDMTVSFPKEGASGDWVEVPIPHQFVHRIVSESVSSQVSDLYR